MSFFKYLSNVIKKRKDKNDLEEIQTRYDDYCKKHDEIEIQEYLSRRRNEVIYDPTVNPGNNYADIHLYDSSTFSVTSTESGTVNVEIKYDYEEASDRWKRKITSIKNNKVKEPKQEPTKKTKFDQILE